MTQKSFEVMFMKKMLRNMPINAFKTNMVIIVFNILFKAIKKECLSSDPSVFGLACTGGNWAEIS